jgi:hypothetical protein
VGAGTRRWDTASNKCWVGANYLPIILTSFAACESGGPYEPDMPDPNVGFLLAFSTITKSIIRKLENKMSKRPAY